MKANKTKTNKRNKNSYDKVAKKILSRKDVVANILKYFVSEFKDMEVKDIKKCLESGKDEDHIKTLKSKDDTIPGAEIYYDVLFNVRLPNTDEEIGIYIDIEAQGSVVNYDLLTRAMYYANRLIARQKGVDFNNQDYGSIKKVYSIWLDTNANKDSEGAINKICFQDYSLSGNFRFDSKSYDLIDVIYVHIGLYDNTDDQYKQIKKLLHSLFVDSQTSNEDKLQIYKNEYDIIDIEKDLKDMCNFSDVIEYKAEQKGLEAGIKQGLQQGRLEGLQEGILNTSYDNVINAMNAFNITLEQALDALKIDDSIKDEIIKKVKE